MTQQRNLAILGSTGSIGQNAILVVKDLPDIRVWGLSGCQRLDLLVAQGRQFPEAHLVAADSSLANSYDVPSELRCRWTTGPAQLCWLASHADVDIVLAAIVGRAGLESAHAAIQHGKTVALANKETLVVAGEILLPLAAQTGARIIPVDSEHSAVWQASLAGRRDEIERVILTASGGPFRGWSSAQMASITPHDALAHPTWNMGPKITIDSATLMNKALEIIEAGWLFELRPDQIQVMIHPQSFVHSLVEFRDGSVIAQLSPPDMKLPIQYALSSPRRLSSSARRMNWSERIFLELIPPNREQIRALELGFEVLRRKGTCGAVLNAVNESAVQAFLAGRIKFQEIVPACERALKEHRYLESPNLEQLLAADAWAREEINAWIGC